MAVEDLYKRACDAVERSNYGYAIELFREVLRQNPDYPDARIALRGTERRRLQQGGSSIGAALGAPVAGLLTSLKAMTGKPRKKLEVFEDYLEKRPDSFWALKKAAAAAQKAGFPEQAIIIYTDALKQKPDHQPSLRRISNILIEVGRSQEALQYLTRLAAMRPEDRDLQNEVRDLEATQHMSSHKMDGAESFRDMVRDKDEAERLEKSRRMAVTMDDLRAEVPEAEKAFEEDPENANKIIRLADLYVDTGELKKARDLLQEKAKQMPEHYDIHVKLADVQLSMYDAAIRAAEQKLEQNPDDAEAKEKLASLMDRRRQFAVKDYSWRLAQHPTDKELQFKLAHAYFDAGQYNEAIANFQATVQDARYGTQSAQMLGQSFLAKGQYDLAVDRLDSAIEDHKAMDDMGKDLRYYRALALEKMGNTDEALKAYKSIYSQDINFRDVAQKVETLS